MKIELYYNKVNDCLQFVENGVLKYHDEYINGCEFLSYFKQDIENVEELKDIPTETIIEAYDCIFADFKFHNSKEEIEEYFQNVKKQKIQGELITAREI